MLPLKEKMLNNKNFVSLLVYPPHRTPCYPCNYHQRHNRKYTIRESHGSHLTELIPDINGMRYSVVLGHGIITTITYVCQDARDLCHVDMRIY